jgi:hypothetical protein
MMVTLRPDGGPQVAWGWSMGAPRGLAVPGWVRIGHLRRDPRSTLFKLVRTYGGF